jgi:hypothetical protein
VPEAQAFNQRILLFNPGLKDEEDKPITYLMLQEVRMR